MNGFKKGKAALNGVMGKINDRVGSPEGSEVWVAVKELKLT